MVLLSVVVDCRLLTGGGEVTGRRNPTLTLLVPTLEMVTGTSNHYTSLANVGKSLSKEVFFNEASQK
jgi:hypothetical protein